MTDPPITTTCTECRPLAVRTVVGLRSHHWEDVTGPGLEAARVGTVQLECGHTKRLVTTAAQAQTIPHWRRL